MGTSDNQAYFVCQKPDLILITDCSSCCPFMDLRAGKKDQMLMPSDQCGRSKLPTWHALACQCARIVLGLDTVTMPLRTVKALPLRSRRWQDLSPIRSKSLAAVSAFKALSRDFRRRRLFTPVRATPEPIMLEVRYRPIYSLIWTPLSLKRTELKQVSSEIVRPIIRDLWATVRIDIFGLYFAAIHLAL